jgi:hypothetical protein
VSTASEPAKRPREPQDWITSFDRDLIRAAQKKLKISLETMDDEEPLAGALVIQVDKYFIKVEKGGVQTWINKSHICKVVVPNG